MGAFSTKQFGLKHYKEISSKAPPPKKEAAAAWPLYLVYFDLIATFDGSLLQDGKVIEACNISLNSMFN